MPLWPPTILNCFESPDISKQTPMHNTYCNLWKYNTLKRNTKQPNRAACYYQLRKSIPAIPFFIYFPSRSMQRVCESAEVQRCNHRHLIFYNISYNTHYSSVSETLMNNKYPKEEQNSSCITSISFGLKRKKQNTLSIYVLTATFWEWIPWISALLRWEMSAHSPFYMTVTYRTAHDVFVNTDILT